MAYTTQNKLPAYLNVAHEIMMDIREGQLKVGERIPSERQIAKERKICRMTARQALKHLIQRGMLETQIGRGTFVRSDAFQQELKALSGFTEDMMRKGLSTSSLIIEAKTHKADPLTRTSLQLDNNAKVHTLTRVRLIEQKPVAIETAQINAAMAPNFFDDVDFTTQSTYAHLRKTYNIIPTTAEQTLEAALVGSEISHQLGLKASDPVLRLTRLTKDSNDRIFEFARSIYRGDAFNMKVHLSLENSV